MDRQGAVLSPAGSSVRGHCPVPAAWAPATPLLPREALEAVALIRRAPW